MKVGVKAGAPSAARSSSPKASSAFPVVYIGRVVPFMVLLSGEGSQRSE